MYTKFFKLKTKPFELVPNPSFLFPSRSHKKALSYLTYGISEGAGFILLTGEVGCGKTTIIRDIVSKIDSKTTLSLIFNTRVNPEQLLSLINDDFGLKVEGKNKISLLKDLNDFLVEQHARKCRPILIVDEAQNLSAEALEEIRLLSNLEAETCKLLQIILVGQPELKEIISRPSLRQLRQRIGIACHINPLSRDETEEYIFHRLETAGNRDAAHFSEGTIDVIFRYSHGIPRLINVFCDFLLLAAFVEGTRELTIDLVEEVVGDVAGGTDFAPFSPGGFPMAGDETIGTDPPDEWGGGGQKRDPFSERLSAHEKILKIIIDRQKTESKRSEEIFKNLSGQMEGMTKVVHRLEKRDGIWGRKFK